jgi:hypothetical protein
LNVVVFRQVLIVAEVKALRSGKRSTKKLKEEYSSRSRCEKLFE